jgi:hypothetical protein
LGKNLNKKRRRNDRLSGSAEIINFQHSKFETERVLPPIKALNPTQADYLDALDRRHARRRPVPQPPHRKDHLDTPERALWPLARLLPRLARG